MLALSLLGDSSSSVSAPYPSLVSMLIAGLTPISGACLEGALNPLSSCTLKQWSVASSAAPDFFSDSLPASCGALAPFRLCSCSRPLFSPWDLTSKALASAPRPHPPWQVSRQAPQAGKHWSALTLYAGISPLCSLHHCCCAFLYGSKAFSLTHPPSPPVKGLPSVWKLFLLHSSLPEVQVPSLFFCLCFFFFFYPTLVHGEFLAFWEVWGLLPAFSRCSVGVVPHADVFLMYL